jgi:hypothetical protein
MSAVERGPRGDRPRRDDEDTRRIGAVLSSRVGDRQRVEGGQGEAEGEVGRRGLAHADGGACGGRDRSDRGEVEASDSHVGLSLRSRRSPCDGRRSGIARQRVAQRAAVADDPTRRASGARADSAHWRHARSRVCRDVGRRITSRRHVPMESHRAAAKR